MNIVLNALPTSAGASDTESASKPARKLEDAAKQFESLMIAQMMKSARDTSGGGWLSDGDETGEDSSMSMAEQQFAQSMANSGGLGLAKMIVRTMTNVTAKVESTALGTAEK